MYKIMAWLQKGERNVRPAKHIYPAKGANIRVALLPRKNQIWPKVELNLKRQNYYW